VHGHSHGCHGPASSDINLELNKNVEHHDEVKFHSHSSHSMNIRAVFLHVLADALGSVAVLISALLVKYVPYDGDWKLVIDPFLSLILTFFIIMSTVPLLKESSLILLQAVPSRVSVMKIKEEIQSIEGVIKINSLQVWSLNSDVYVASITLVVSGSASCNDSSICMKVKRILKNNHVNISTVQTDYETPSISSACILSTSDVKETSINDKDFDKVVVDGENVVFDLTTYKDKLNS
jgi:zinc transporter 1